MPGWAHELPIQLVANYKFQILYERELIIPLPNGFQNKILIKIAIRQLENRFHKWRL